MSRKNAKPELLGPLVWKILKRRGYETPVKEQMVLQQWPKIVGETIAAETIAESIENKKIFVRVASAAWRNELVFLKAEILKKIQDFTGKKTIHDIIFLSGKRKEVNGNNK